MIIYATDIHLTNRQPTNRMDDIVKGCLLKFECLLQLADKNKASIILGGDLFSGACPSYELLTDVIEILEKYPKVKLYTIYGNHDIIQTNIEGDNAAIHALTKSGYLQRLYLNKATVIDDCYVYGLDYTKEMLNDICVPEENGTQILVTHLPLFPEKQVFDTVNINDFKTNCKFVLCSHIHNQFDVSVNNVRFLNPGPLCRLKRTEENIIPSVYIYDNGNWTLKAISDVKAQFRTKDITTDTVDELDEYVKLETQDVKTVLRSQCSSDLVYNTCLSLMEAQSEEK